MFKTRGDSGSKKRITSCLTYIWSNSQKNGSEIKLYFPNYHNHLEAAFSSDIHNFLFTLALFLSLSLVLSLSLLLCERVELLLGKRRSLYCFSSSTAIFQWLLANVFQRLIAIFGCMISPGWLDGQ